MRKFLRRLAAGVAAAALMGCGPSTVKVILLILPTQMRRDSVSNWQVQVAMYSRRTTWLCA